MGVTPRIPDRPFHPKGFTTGNVDHRFPDHYLGVSVRFIREREAWPALDERLLSIDVKRHPQRQLQMLQLFR
jgi:hypothetical protein